MAFRIIICDYVHEEFLNFFYLFLLPFIIVKKRCFGAGLVLVKAICKRNYLFFIGRNKLYAFKANALEQHISLCFSRVTA